jgi:GTPase SAR1 family protein
MKIVKNKLSDVGKAQCDCENLSGLPYIPHAPLPCKNFAMLLCGAPQSGKTNLLIQLLMSHSTKKVRKNLYYYGFFDKIQLISPSLATLPETFKKNLDDSQKNNKFSDELIEKIINEFYNGENTNNLLLLDDCVKDIHRSRILSKIFLNRRHICQNNDKITEDCPHTASLSIIVTSQKFSLLPLEFRAALSDIIVFKSSNKSEINRIKDELLFDLSPEDQDELLNNAWREAYSFLYIKPNNTLENKYFIKFNKVIFS